MIFPLIHSGDPDVIEATFRFPSARNSSNDYVFNNAYLSQLVTSSILVTDSHQVGQQTAEAVEILAERNGRALTDEDDENKKETIKKTAE